MITLHEAGSTNFLDNNGLGILKDCTSSEVIESINEEFSITIVYQYNGYLYKELIENRIIVSDVGYGERQAFVIKKIEETLTTKKVYATHIFYDLADNFLEDVYPQELNGNAALNWILSRTQYEHKFSGFSDVAKVATARYVRKNIVQALIGNEDNSFVNKWGGEIIRDNYNISIVNQRHSTNNKKTIRYRKNLKGINFNIDFTSVVTRAMPIGYDGLLLPERYVDSPLINNYPHPIIKIIEYGNVKVKEQEDEEGFETKEEAYEELRRLIEDAYVAGIDKPTLSTTIEFAYLADTEEYKEYKNLESLYIGDTINVFIDKINVDIEQRIIKTTYNPLTKKFTKYELGTIKANYASQSVKTENKLQEITLPNLLSIAKESATAQLIAALGGYVYKTQNELFIMDTNDPNTAQKVWRWNLNGLGYSPTGINGEYQLAMTQDGKIVADFITTGTMAVDRVEGLAGTLQLITKNISDTIENLNIVSMNLNNITSSVRMIGGNNKQKNSIGAYGTSDYEQSEEGNIVATEEELLKPVTDNGFGRIIYISDNKWFKFRSESLVIGEAYTISFKYSNMLNNHCVIKLNNNIETTIIDTLEEKELESIEYTFIANTEYVELYVETGDYTLGITDYYLQTGNLATKWQSSAGEALSTVLSIYYNGIKVTSENSEIITQISNLGFSVVNVNGKVLITFNKDQCILGDTQLNGVLDQKEWLRYVETINNKEVLLEVKI